MVKLVKLPKLRKISKFFRNFPNILLKFMTVLKSYKIDISLCLRLNFIFIFPQKFLIKIKKQMNKHL